MLLLWTTLFFLLAQCWASSFLYVKVDNPAAGNLPTEQLIAVTPPGTFGQHPFPNTGNPTDFINGDTSGNPASDRFEIALSEVSQEVQHSLAAHPSWGPFNQYPVIQPWENTVFPGVSDTPNGNFPAAGVITSSPACLFAVSVAAGGKKITFFLLNCARQFSFANANPPPGVGLIDVLVIYLPWPFLNANPTYPQAVVSMQATFFIFNPADLSFNVIGPDVVDTPFVTTAPELGLSSLSLLDFYPGAPAAGVPINTIVNGQIEAVTVTFHNGVELQGGNTVTLATSTVLEYELFANQPAVLKAPTPGLVWANPNSLNGAATAFIAVGPACGVNNAAVNCCSQSTARVTAPRLSFLTFPAWWTSMVITLAPAGCVLPADKRISFVIPRFYLGKNPGVTRQIQDGQEVVWPGWVHVDVRMMTSAEPHAHILQRFLESNPLTWNGFLPLGEPAPLVPRMSSLNLVSTLGPAAYVVGPSTVAALKVQVDTVVATLQPQKMDIAITLRTGLSPVDSTTTTPYKIALGATQGVFRHNIAQVSATVPVEVVQPAGCKGRVFAFSSGYGTLFMTLSDATCVAALGADGAVLAFSLDGTFLLPTPSAGITVTFDVRVIPPQLSNARSGPNRGAAAQADSAALMNVVGYTTVADCSVMPYSLGAVGDIAAMSRASRCTVIGAMAQISPVTAGFLQCNPNANVDNAANMITYVKIPEGQWSSVLWPKTNAAVSASAWPQNVAMGGSPPIAVAGWGYMFSTPMFAVVVSYPPRRSSLPGLDVNPQVPSAWQVAFVLRVDRVTAACSTTATQENPFIFCVTTPLNVASVQLFPSSPRNTAGIPVETIARSGWGKTSSGVCVTIVSDGAVVGWYAVGASPSADDDSDGAWYAFFAFFALPLLLLCCCLAALLYFLKLRKPKECCPAVPQYPVQEMYWVNSATAPIISAPSLCSPAAQPLYLAAQY